MQALELAASLKGCCDDRRNTGLDIPDRQIEHDRRCRDDEVVGLSVYDAL